MSKSVLIVDDDRTLTRLLKKFLEDSNYDVLIADDGEEAIAKLEKSRPDLIILDIHMPKLNGYSFLFAIRQLPNAADVPVIILTCKPEMEDIFRVEGVKEYLIKPVNNDVLLQKIRQHLNG